MDTRVKIFFTSLFSTWSASQGPVPGFMGVLPSQIQAGGAGAPGAGCSHSAPWWPRALSSCSAGGEASARALVCVCQAPIPGLHVKEFLPSSRCSLMPIPYVFLSTGRHQSRSAQEKQEIGNGNCFKLDLNGVQMLSYAC